MDIQSEYLELLIKRATIVKSINECPNNFLKQKAIKRQTRFYLPRRKKKTKIKYMLSGVDEVTKKYLDVLAAKQKELPIIEARIENIEKDAELLGGEFRRQIVVAKSIAGIETYTTEERREIVKFSEAITSIEGAPVSAVGKRALKQWAEGKAHYTESMNSVLKHYGFAEG